MSVILLYFHGFEVLRNPGWIVHSLLTLPLSFSFVSPSAPAKVSPWWWIPGWLSAGADGLLCSLLHAPVVCAAQSAGLTESINRSGKGRSSESSGPIWDVLMWHSLTYTTCMWQICVDGDLRSGCQPPTCPSLVWEGWVRRVGNLLFLLLLFPFCAQNWKRRSCDLKKL